MHSLDDATTAAGRPTPAPLDQSPIRVMVVDDDPTSLELMTRLLELDREQFEVHAASDGVEALELFEQHQPQVVITDLMMPGLDGEQLLQQIKAQNPAVVVLIMSVMQSVEQAVRLLRSGADDYLTKPVAAAVLKQRLGAVAARLRLSRDVRALRDLIDFAFNPGEQFVLGTSAAFLRVVAKIPGLASTDAAVLIGGESGTGKELVARAIHQASHRSGGPMVSVSCSTIPDGLWEREFFGHVKGAFSDSGEGGPGYVTAAHEGTLFLDEVGEIQPAMQAKLLRFLQEKEYRAVGSTRLQQADVRLVSATNRDLAAEVAAGRFRQDLYYRLNVLPLQMPALRQRKEDIPHLATHFVKRYAEAFGRPVVGLSPLALQKLSSHSWPGNVRELENVIQQAMVAARFSVLCADDVPVGDAAISEAWPVAASESPPPQPAQPPQALPLDQPFKEVRQQLVDRFERDYVQAMLQRHAGNVSHAAAAAGLPRKSFSRIMSRHSLRAGPDGRGGRPGRPRKE